MQTLSSWSYRGYSSFLWLWRGGCTHSSFQQGPGEHTGRPKSEIKKKVLELLMLSASCFCYSRVKASRRRETSVVRWSHHGTNFISRWFWESKPVCRPWLRYCRSPRLGLPSQAHHSDGDGISDVCCRRIPLPAPVSRGDRGVPLCSLGLSVHWADVCCGGAGVDPYTEGEAETEAVHTAWRWIGDGNDFIM